MPMTIVPIADPVAEERERIIAIAERLILLGVSPGYLRLAALANRTTKPTEAKKSDLDPMETHK